MTLIKRVSCLPAGLRPAHELGSDPQWPRPVLSNQELVRDAWYP